MRNQYISLEKASKFFSFQDKNNSNNFRMPVWRQAPVVAFFPPILPAAQYQKNCKNKCEENNNIYKTRLDAMKTLFQANHEYVVVIKEIFCNRNMSFSYQLLGTLKTTISKFFLHLYGNM